MKVLITGGCGYIGTEIVPIIVKSEEVKQVVIYDNLSRKNYGLFLNSRFPYNEKVKFIEGDILDSRLLKKEVKEVDTIVHLAAKVSTPYASDDPHFFDQVNNWGTAELVYAVETSSNIKKIIHLSTTSIYGFTEEPIDETFIPNPGLSYGLSKLRGENHVRRLISSAQCEVIILRLSNVFGFNPSIRFDAVINKFVFDANFLNKIYLHGFGSQTRPFIHISEAAHVIISCLTGNVRSGIYNVFNSNLKISDIVDILKRIYQGLEVHYLNQHITYGSLFLKYNSVIEDILKPEKRDIDIRIKEFCNNFGKFDKK